MHDPTLSELRREFKSHRLIAMPIAGTIAWTLVAIAGVILPTPKAALALFMLTGMIFGLAVVIGPLVGDPIIRRDRPNSELDKMFFYTIAMANLAWAIVIPFFLTDPTSLPLGAGILAGLMWLPMTWIIEHWVGIFHAVARTIGIVIVHYAFPESRFVAIPLVIVAVYLVSIVALVQRHSRYLGETAGAAPAGLRSAES